MPADLNNLRRMEYTLAKTCLELEIEPDPESDLVEDAMAQCITHGGSVYAVGDEFSTGKALRAVIRYW